MELPNDLVSPLFEATIEATEEAIYDSLFAAVTMTGYRGRTVKALPVDRVLDLMHSVPSTSAQWRAEKGASRP